MFQLVNIILHEFRNCFKRIAAWKWFVVLVLGFMLRSKHMGVTSTISQLRLDPKVYHKMLHFFRSQAYEVVDLYEKWTELVLKDQSVLRISERIVMNGDHIKISKEGRRMPDIEILHQESENSGKGEYIAGHTYAQIAGIITSNNTSRSIPLVTEPQKSPPKIPGTKKPDGDTLVIQMAKLALNAAEYAYKATGETSIGAFDAYFSKGTMFNTLKSKRTPDGRPLMSIVTRAQDSYVGFVPAVPPQKNNDNKRGPGRPKKEEAGKHIYGEKIKLKDLLKDTSKFTETTLVLYGKKAKVKYFCIDLLWKSTDDIVRFIVVDSDRGQCVLMSDDLTLEPEEIITIYSLRFKIETGFDEQKNDIGCFEYHFWTKCLEKRKKRKASAPPPLSDERSCLKVNEAKKAISSFVCLGTIATGILTIIAFKHDCEIWARYPGWIRTLRVRIPSIAVTREALAQDFHALLHRFPHSSVSRVVTPLLRESVYLYMDFDADALDEPA